MNLHFSIAFQTVICLSNLTSSIVVPTVWDFSDAAYVFFSDGVIGFIPYLYMAEIVRAVC